MLRFYDIYYTTYHNGVAIGTEYRYGCFDKAPTEEDVAITWDNLYEMYHKYALCFNFNIWEFKKGRVVSFFSDRWFDKDSRDVKEWKTSDLHITLTIRYKEDNPSIDRVMKYHDGEKAIQYLVERGLTVIK